MNRRKYSFFIFVPWILAAIFCSPAFADEPPPSTEVQQTVAKVDKAANLLSSQGKGAFPQFRVKDGEWWKGESYIYVYDLNGTLLVNPLFAIYEGQNLMNTRDVHLKAFVQELTQIAKAKGSGWFSFMLPRPGQPAPSQKWAYVKTVKIPEGETLVVGSGFWVK